MTTRKKSGSRSGGPSAPRGRGFMQAPAYQNLKTILHLSDSNKEAAARLGISDRTLRRWKANGIPEKSKQKYGRKIAHVSGGLKSAEHRKPPSVRKEPRSFYYYRNYGGVRTKHWVVDGAPYDELLYILVHECNKEIYSGFSFLLKLEAPFSGIWDGENKYPENDLQKMSSKDRREIRSSGSWLDITMSDPFISTRLMPLLPERCHPDEFIEALNHYHGLKNTSIYEIRIKEWRQFEDEK